MLRRLVGCMIARHKQAGLRMPGIARPMRRCAAAAGARRCTLGRVMSAATCEGRCWRSRRAPRAIWQDRRWKRPVPGAFWARQETEQAQGRLQPAGPFTAALHPDIALGFRDKCGAKSWSRMEEDGDETELRAGCNVGGWENQDRQWLSGIGRYGGKHEWRLGAGRSLSHVPLHWRLLDGMCGDESRGGEDTLTSSTHHLCSKY